MSGVDEERAPAADGGGEADEQSSAEQTATGSRPQEALETGPEAGAGENKTGDAGPAVEEDKAGEGKEQEQGESQPALSSPGSPEPASGAATEPPTAVAPGEAPAPTESKDAEAAESAAAAAKAAARIDKHLKAANQQQGVLHGAEELLARVEELVDPALRPALQSTAHTLQRAREALDAVHRAAADGSPPDTVSSRVNDLKIAVAAARRHVDTAAREARNAESRRASALREEAQALSGRPVARLNPARRRDLRLEAVAPSLHRAAEACDAACEAAARPRVSFFELQEQVQVAAEALAAAREAVAGAESRWAAAEESQWALQERVRMRFEELEQRKAEREARRREVEDMEHGQYLRLCRAKWDKGRLQREQQQKQQQQHQHLHEQQQQQQQQQWSRAVSDGGGSSDDQFSSSESLGGSVVSSLTSTSGAVSRWDEYGGGHSAEAKHAADELIEDSAHRRGVRVAPQLSGGLVGQGGALADLSDSDTESEAGTESDAVGAGVEAHGAAPVVGSVPWRRAGQGGDAASTGSGSTMDAANVDTMPQAEAEEEEGQGVEEQQQPRRRRRRRRRRSRLGRALRAEMARFRSPWEAAKMGCSPPCFAALVAQEGQRQRVQEGRAWHIDKRDVDTGESLLFNAARYHHPRLVAWALRHGADARQQDSSVFRTTALHVAAEGSAAECITPLLRAGGNPRATDARGDTPLHCAARAGSFQTCMALLQFAAQGSVVPDLRVSEVGEDAAAAAREAGEESELHDPGLLGGFLRGSSTSSTSSGPGSGGEGGGQSKGGGLVAELPAYFPVLHQHVVQARANLLYAMVRARNAKGYTPYDVAPLGGASALLRAVQWHFFREDAEQLRTQLLESRGRLQRLRATRRLHQSLLERRGYQLAPEAGAAHPAGASATQHLRRTSLANTLSFRMSPMLREQGQGTGRDATGSVGTASVLLPAGAGDGRGWGTDTPAEAALARRAGQMVQGDTAAAAGSPLGGRKRGSAGSLSVPPLTFSGESQGRGMHIAAGEPAFTPPRQPARAWEQRQSGTTSPASAQPAVRSSALVGAERGALVRSASLRDIGGSRRRLAGKGRQSRLAAAMAAMGRSPPAAQSASPQRSAGSRGDALPPVKPRAAPLGKHGRRGSVLLAPGADDLPLSQLLEERNSVRREAESRVEQVVGSRPVLGKPHLPKSKTEGTLRTLQRVIQAEAEEGKARARLRASGHKPAPTVPEALVAANPKEATRRAAERREALRRQLRMEHTEREAALEFERRWREQEEAAEEERRQRPQSSHGLHRSGSGHPYSPGGGRRDRFRQQVAGADVYEAEAGSEAMLVGDTASVASAAFHLVRGSGSGLQRGRRRARRPDHAQGLSSRPRTAQAGSGASSSPRKRKTGTGSDVQRRAALARRATYQRRRRHGARGRRYGGQFGHGAMVLLPWEEEEEVEEERRAARVTEQERAAKDRRRRLRRRWSMRGLGEGEVGSRPNSARTNASGRSRSPQVGEAAPSPVAVSPEQERVPGPAATAADIGLGGGPEGPPPTASLFLSPLPLVDADGARADSQQARMLRAVETQFGAEGDVAPETAAAGGVDTGQLFHALVSRGRELAAPLEGLTAKQIEAVRQSGDVGRGRGVAFDPQEAEVQRLEQRAQLAFVGDSRVRTLRLTRNANRPRPAAADKGGGEEEEGEGGAEDAHPQVGRMTHTQWEAYKREREERVRHRREHRDEIREARKRRLEEQGGISLRVVERENQQLLREVTGKGGPTPGRAPRKDGHSRGDGV